MTLLRNQSMPRSAARLLTAVGLRRVSIGPPISVIDSGTKGSLLGFHHGNRRHHRHRRLAHRDDMHVAAEHVQHLDDVIDIVVEIEAAFGQRHHPRIGPVGDVDLMGRQEGFDRAAQQRRVVAGHRRHDQHARLRAAQRPGQLAIEIQQPAERLFPDRADLDRRADAVDLGVVRGPIRACRSGAWCARTIRSRRRSICRTRCATTD